MHSSPASYAPHSPALGSPYFGLTWLGKEAAEAEPQRPLDVAHVEETGPQDAPHSVTVADNLDALKHFRAQGFHADVIYIDPPLSLIHI